MPLTKIWGAILATLASLFLAGMFLLSLGSPDGFSPADKEALRAVTQAGLSSLHSDLQSSAVSRAPAILSDPRLASRLGSAEGESGAQLLKQALADVAEELLLADHPKMTLGLVDTSGTIIAASGLTEHLLAEVVASSVYQSTPTDVEVQLSATLGGRLHVVRVSRATAKKQRLVAIEALDLGAGSSLRRVFGNNYSAAIARDAEILGDAMGPPAQREIETLAATHAADVPDQGVGEVVLVGSGLNARIGAMARVPGPAGVGKTGTVLVVLSGQTAAAGQRGLSTVVAEAIRGGQLGRLNWPVLAVVFLASLSLALYLPNLELLGPMRRLSAEFRAVAQGRQHQIFHDGYSGTAGEVARAAASAHESLRSVYLDDLGDDDEGIALPGIDLPASPSDTAGKTPRDLRSSPAAPASGSASPTAKSSAATPSSKPSARSGGAGSVIELPSPGEDAVLESHSHDLDRSSESPTPPKSAGAAHKGPGGASSGKAASAPGSTPKAATPVSLHEASDQEEQLLSVGLLSDADDASHGSAHKPSRPGAERAAVARPSTERAPAPPPLSAKETLRPASAPTAAAADPREGYYREIYDEFVQTKLACGEATEGFTFEKFARKLRKNTEELMSRPGVKDALFTVYVKDGKAALKAKVVKD